MRNSELILGVILFGFLLHSIYLALFIKHGYGCQVVSRVKSGFGVGRLGDWALHVGPGVHDVVSVTVIVEVLALKDQSQSPTERRRGLRVIYQIDESK